MSTSGYLKIR